MTRYYKPVADTPVSPQVAVEVGQVRYLPRARDYRDEGEWLVAKIQGGAVELHAMGVAVGGRTMVRSKFWVKRWMVVK